MGVPVLTQRTVYGERGQDMHVFRDADHGQVMPSSRAEIEAAPSGYRAPLQYRSTFGGAKR